MQILLASGALIHLQILKRGEANPKIICIARSIYCSLTGKKLHIKEMLICAQFGSDQRYEDMKYENIYEMRDYEDI